MRVCYTRVGVHIYVQQDAQFINFIVYRCEFCMYSKNKLVTAGTITDIIKRRH